MSGTLTLTQAKTVMQQILDELDKEDIKETILASREEAGADIGQIMEKVVPVFFEIQGHCMEPFGFVPDDEGFAAFADELKKHESNAEFKVLSDKLKKIMKDSTTPYVAPESEEEEETE